MPHPVLELMDLAMPWQGLDPFLFTVHHVDHYPAGNPDQGPDSPLAGRRIGADFSYLDGWSMYHGRSVPGFDRVARVFDVAEYDVVRLHAGANR